MQKYLRFQEFFFISPHPTPVCAIFVNMKSMCALILLFFSVFSNAQTEITWSGTFNAKENKALITAQLEEGWHVYSMIVDEMAGPVSTKFELAENPSVKVLGEVQEPEPLVSFDENFEAELQYFEKTVTFEQELMIKKSTELKYTVTYMICNDVMCYPPVDEVVQISILK